MAGNAAVATLVDPSVPEPKSSYFFSFFSFLSLVVTLGLFFLLSFCCPLAMISSFAECRWAAVDHYIGRLVLCACAMLKTLHWPMPQDVLYVACLSQPRAP